MTDCSTCDMPDGDHDFACPFHEWNLWKLPHEFDRDLGVVFPQCRCSKSPFDAIHLHGAGSE